MAIADPGSGERERERERVLMKPIRIFPKEFLAQQAICYSSSLPGAEVEKLDPGKLQPREGKGEFSNQ